MNGKVASFLAASREKPKSLFVTPNEFAKEIAASRDFLGLQTAENSP